MSPNNSIVTYKDLTKPADPHIKHLTEYDDNTTTLPDGTWSILESRLKIDGRWMNSDTKIDESLKHIKVVRVAEYMYALAPFYTFSKTLKGIWEQMITPMLNKLAGREIPPFVTDFIRKRIVWYIIKLKPHHTKTLVQYNDGSCDTFEMYATDNPLEIDAKKFSVQDKKYLEKRGMTEFDMYTFDHLDMFYVDHFSKAEAGEDCINAKKEHGLIDRSYFYDVLEAEPMRKWDALWSWWLNEGDNIMEYIQKYPFRVTFNIARSIMKQRLDGAKRLGRMNRILFETELGNPFGDYLSEDRLWLNNNSNPDLSRYDLYNFMVRTQSKMLNYDNFWANCQDMTAGVVRQAIPGYQTYSEWDRQILGYLELDQVYYLVTRYLLVVEQYGLLFVKAQVLAYRVFNLQGNSFEKNRQKRYDKLKEYVNARRVGMGNYMDYLRVNQPKEPILNRILGFFAKVREFINDCQKDYDSFKNNYDYIVDSFKEDGWKI